MSASRILLTVIVVSYFVGTAAAEPIEWSYTVRSDTLTGAPWLSLGTVGQWNWSPETGDYYESHRLYQSRWEFESSGTLSGSLLSTHPAEGLTVAGVGYPEAWVPADAPIDRTSDPAVRVAFLLTDSATGESGNLAFEFEPWASEAVYYNGGPGVVGWSNAPQSNSIIVGRTRFEVTIHSQDRESWTPLIATIDVQSVPEPSTLLLAGIGLTGLVRFRRWI